MSKRMVEANKLVEPGKMYDVAEAIDLALKMPKAKFDETLEMHIKLGVDSKQADQQVRGVMVLPNGTGKSKKVLVIAKGAFAEEAKKAGADFVGEKDMLDKIKNENWFDFDVVVATPDMMPEVGKIGNILGPRNLMPNPKTGTVTTKVGAIVEDLKKGMVTYKNDKFGNIHTVIGKVSFDEKKLAENLSYVVTTISKAKPQTVKGTFIENIAISTTMGPGIKLDKNSFDI